MARRFRRIGLRLFIGISILAGAITVGGLVRGTQDFKLTCSGFTSNGGRLIFDRDNTGQGLERFSLLATDGAGKVIYGPIVQDMPIGSSIEYPQGFYQAWQAAPEINPLFLTITSEEGNGQVKETIYRRTDTCRTLEGYSREVIESSTFGDVGPVDGETAPAMALNQRPVTPVSINDLADLLGLSGYGIVNTSRLNMRSGAGIQYERVAILNGGTEVAVLGRNENATWWYVQVDETRGWVSADYVILRGDLRAQGLVPSTGEIAKPRFIFYQDYPVYDVPSTQGRVMCEMAGNLEYSVVGRNDDWTWYKIDAVCNGVPMKAWADGSLGALRRDGQEVPLVE
jgi:hypothetical protein